MINFLILLSIIILLAIIFVETTLISSLNNKLANKINLNNILLNELEELKMKYNDSNCKLGIYSSRLSDAILENESLRKDINREYNERMVENKILDSYIENIQYMKNVKIR